MQSGSEPCTNAPSSAQEIAAHAIPDQEAPEGKKWRGAASTPLHFPDLRVVDQNSIMAKFEQVLVPASQTW